MSATQSRRVGRGGEHGDSLRKRPSTLARSGRSSRCARGRERRNPSLHSLGDEARRRDGLRGRVGRGRRRRAPRRSRPDDDRDARWARRRDPLDRLWMHPSELPRALGAASRRTAPRRHRPVVDARPLVGGRRGCAPDRRPCSPRSGRSTGPPAHRPPTGNVVPTSAPVRGRRARARGRALGRRGERARRQRDAPGLRRLRPPRRRDPHERRDSSATATRSRS